MILTLEVHAPQGAKPGAQGRHAFGEEGGTIGRLSGSSLVLPHSSVSGCHARISYRNAVFYIEDTSRNGIGVNSADNRLVRGRPYALKSGDLILIDPYELHVSIGGGAAEMAQNPPVDSSAQWPPRVQPAQRPARAHIDESDAFRSDDPFAPPPVSQHPAWAVAPASEATGEGELDPLKALGLSTAPAPARKAPIAEDLAHGSLLDDHFQPPVVLSPSASLPRPLVPPLIPQDYNPIYDSLVIDVPAELALPVLDPMAARPSDPWLSVPPPSPAPVSREGATQPEVARASTPDAAIDALRVTEWLASMLAGAGVDGAVATPELARNFGQILRVVVSGVMDVLQARQQIKEEFRMRTTHFRPADNNPLKYSANVDDALHNLLVKRNAAYLGPVEAFADAFDDLRHHQMAMLAGMRVAFEAMLAEFDPDRMQEQFDRQLSKGSLLSVPAKLRYWDLYRERRRDMVKDPEASFGKLFGEEFARAYEEQFRRLKAEARARTGTGSTRE